MKTWTLILALLGVSLMCSAAAAQETGQSTGTGSRRAYRQQIKSMHILDRPSRPGHFYGNTVWRRYNGRSSAGLRRGR